jgi:hypothetical protein
MWDTDVQEENMGKRKRYTAEVIAELAEELFGLNKELIGRKTICLNP